MDLSEKKKLRRYQNPAQKKFPLTKIFCFPWMQFRIKKTKTIFLSHLLLLLSALASACRHNCLVGGVADVVVASDKKRVISVGEDGLMVVWSLAGQRDLPAKPFAIGAMETVADAKVPEPQEITYIMKAEEERTKVLQTKYEWHRKEVSGKIGTLRDQLQEYKQENTTAAADEKLETQAFMIESQRLEIEEQGRQLMAEKEDEIKWTNLAKDCISDRIKKQCWDSMSQHLKILKGMQEKTKIEVPSYVIQKTTHDDRTLLRKVKFLREVCHVGYTLVILGGFVGQ